MCIDILQNADWKLEPAIEKWNSMYTKEQVGLLKRCVGTSDGSVMERILELSNGDIQVAYDTYIYEEKEMKKFEKINKNNEEKKRQTEARE